MPFTGFSLMLSMRLVIFLLFQVTEIVSHPHLQYPNHLVYIYSFFFWVGGEGKIMPCLTE